MARPKNPERSIKANLSIPEGLHTKIKDELFSTAEGRIPHGKLSEFFVNLALQYYADKQTAAQKEARRKAEHAKSLLTELQSHGGDDYSAAV